MARSIGKFLGKVFGVMVAFACLLGCGLLLGSVFGVPTIIGVIVIGLLWYFGGKR